jgi:hypothetical protein
MGKIEVVKAESKREMDDFIRLPYYIYENCAQYVPDLEREIRNLFNQKNPAREFSQIQPFVAYRDGVCVGRIVGIINRKANERWKTHNVRFSLIEFEDDLEVSKALIEAVSEWGQSQGMDAIHGPLGITDFDKEGMLMEDFDLMGSMNTVYNLEYYPRHMEALGFEKEVDWVQIRINIPQEIPARYARTAQYAREQIGLRVVKLNRNAKNLQDCVRKVFELFNEAYASIFGFSEISMEQADMFLDKYLSLIDLNLIPIVLNEKDEIVGVAVTMGSLSKAMRKANGKLWPLGWWPLLKALKWRPEDNAEMLLVAVRPDYQGLGVNALFFDDLIPVYNEYGFQWAETGPQLEDNMRELTQWKPLKPVFVKRRRCFKKEMRK